MLALGDNAALAYHDNMISPANLRQTMGNEQHGAAFGGVPDGLLNFIFSGTVDGAGAVIQYKNGRITLKGACDGNTLPLSAAEGRPTLSHDGIITFGQLCNELVSLGFLGGLFDFSRSGILITECNILGDAAAEKE